MYSRSTGGGLMGLAVVLIVIGAILRFAVTVTTSGFNIHKIGDIMLVVGIVLAVVSIVLLVMGSRRRVTTRTDIRGTPTDEQWVRRADVRGTPAEEQRVHEREEWGGDPY
jgi:beta-lactamase regulating signal transducer with metallopeptidase domain